jgi:hypothetical protein
MREVVQGFLALARLQSGSKPEVQAVVNSLQLTGSGSTVTLSFSIPAEVLDAIAMLQGPGHDDHHDRDDDHHDRDHRRHDSSEQDDEP